MESFMYAPVGVFAGGDNGDADSLSAPHCKESIATRAPRGNRVNHRGRALTSLGVDALPLGLLLCTPAMAKIRIGPAGWSYSDWAGYVYPVPRPKGFHEATYLAQFFDTIEINTSF